jgi:hypothetical protein
MPQLTAATETGDGEKSGGERQVDATILDGKPTIGATGEIEAWNSVQRSDVPKTREETLKRPARFCPNPKS